MSARVEYVKLDVHNSVIQRIKARSKSQLQSWANDVLRQEVEPVTPIDTGALRRSGDVSVSGEVEVWFYWRAPYSLAVERMREYGKSPRTPGTIAPFAEPTIIKAVKREIGQPIGKAFGG